MCAIRRLTKELQEIREADLKAFRDINVEESNILQWTGILLPESAPYNKGAFRIKIDFPPEYPFKPPKITFQTKIYHPNIGTDGRVCLSIMCPCTWRPATRTEHVIQALLAALNELDELDSGHVERHPLADEFTRDKEKFMKNAEEFTKNNIEERPSD